MTAPIVTWGPARLPFHLPWPALATAIGVAGLGWVRPTAPCIVYNASASAPIGFYRVLPVSPLNRGDLVLARTPASVRALAAARGYLPEGVPLVKRIAALGGDTVCGAGGVVSINGHPVAKPLRADRLGRLLPAWADCRPLHRNEAFLLMAGVPASFDGRYFGPIPLSDIIGRVAPLGRS